MAEPAGIEVAADRHDEAERLAPRQRGRAGPSVRVRAAAQLPPGARGERRVFSMPTLDLVRATSEEADRE